MSDKNYENKQIIVSVSGGKDSTAMCLNLLEQGYSTSDFIRVFCDTGWEDEGTYEYLDYLEETIGKIDRIKADIKVKPEDQEFLEYIESKIGESQMVRAILKNGIFPSGAAKFCTRMLKLEALEPYFDAIDDDMVNLVGIRREESAKRAKMHLDRDWERSHFSR